jgi:ubiquinone/menaquinone biosynthesis C-methylase UbiE
MDRTVPSLLRDLVNLPLCFVYLVYHLVLLLHMSLLLRKKFHSVFRQKFEEEQEKRMESVRSYLTEGEQVLDVGAGKGFLGERLHKVLGVSVTGIDLVNCAAATIPFVVYDGKTFPFPEKSFDTVLLSFVLHHCADQDQVLNESIRCARKQIIVIEDSYTSPWEHLFIMWNDYRSNIFQGRIKVWKGLEPAESLKMPMPLAFRSPKGWVRYFSQFQLKIAAYSIRRGLKPHTKIAFQLALTH